MTNDYDLEWMRGGSGCGLL